MLQIKSFRIMVLREVLHHGSLHHPFIVGLREAFLTPRYLAIAMEYAAGGDLFHHLLRQVEEGGRGGIVGEGGANVGEGGVNLGGGELCLRTSACQSQLMCRLSLTITSAKGGGLSPVPGRTGA